MILPKYVSYWYVQDAIKKATRDCMYYGPNHPQCKESWKEVECIDAYFNDRFKVSPVITKQETEACIDDLKNKHVSKNKNADLCEDTYRKDSDSRSRVK